MSRLSITLVALLLGGCGFQLQGAYTLPTEVSSGTYISTTDRYSQFYRELSGSLADAGVELLDAPTESGAVLTILGEDTGQRVLSVSARNVPTEYEVYYTVDYTLSAGQETLLSNGSLTLTRDYTYDENLVLGKAAEEQQLRDAIVSDLVRILLKQIDSL